MLQVHFQWLLVAVVAVLWLDLKPTLATHFEELKDVPQINFDNLFRAYITLGDALFGTWTPANYVEELQRLKAGND